jgi:predicted aspartyl protease
LGLLLASVTPGTTSALTEGSETPAEGSEPSLLATPTTHDHVGRVVMPVTINNRGPFRFIVDTGANHSTISPQLARTLGLQPAEATPVLLDGITGSAHVSFVTVDKLQAGDLLLHDETLPVIAAPVLAGADGILGAAGLRSKTLVVDFLRNQVLIGHAVTASIRDQSTKIRAVRLTYGLITLRTRVGGVNALAVIDTGSERTLGNVALRNALSSKGKSVGLVEVTTVYGATEKTEMAEIRTAPTIVLDSLRINDVKVLYGDFHIFKVWNMADKPAMIIGMDVLGTVPALGIDFDKQEVYVAGSPNSNNRQFQPPPGGNLGNSMDKK